MRIPNQTTCPSNPDAHHIEDRRIGLRVVQSPDPAAERRFFEVGDRALVLGRDVDGEGQIDDPMLSRRHFKVRADGTDVYIEDLDSKNGTSVMGQRIESAVITEGSIIRAGSTLFVVDREVDPDLLPASDYAEGELVVEVVGDSFASRQLRQAVATVAHIQDPVLILGETGTGKEVTARAIHRLSGRKGPFVAVNCAAIPVDLAEAEFFGYRKGAFTGADMDRAGYFAQSSGGTLFLDEVGELPATLQAKLLRTLEDGFIQPLGGGPPVEIDLRVVAATNADLEENGFRSDLLARLGDWVLHLFPLTQRRADIMPLWDHFLGQREKRARRSVAFTEALLLHDWPLNARALRKVARRLAALAGENTEWSLAHLPTPIRRTSTVREQTERTPPDRSQLESALDAAGGNVSKVAAQLGYDRKQIYRWMQRLGLAPSRFRAASNEE